MTTIRARFTTPTITATPAALERGGDAAQCLRRRTGRAALGHLAHRLRRRRVHDNPPSLRVLKTAHAPRY